MDQGGRQYEIGKGDERVGMKPCLLFLDIHYTYFTGCCSGHASPPQSPSNGAHKVDPHPWLTIHAVLAPATSPQTPNPNSPQPSAHTQPAAPQLKLSVSRMRTTFSLPLIASLNFSTNGIFVCLLSFQKSAMCVRAV